jgi:hypothetical protein
MTPMGSGVCCEKRGRYTPDELARKHAGCTTTANAMDGGSGGGGGGDGSRGTGTAVAASGAGASSSAAVGAGGAGGSFESAAGAAAAVVPCLRQAVERIRSRAAEERRVKSGRRVHVLVTGSLYLVGDMLRLLGRAG